MTFTTFPLPAPPTIVAPGSTSSPGSNLGTLTPSFEWNSVNGATGYGLYIRDLTTDTLIYDNIGGAKSGTSFTLPSGYLSNNGHSYRWAMTSFSGGYESAQGSYRYFKAPVAAVYTLSIASSNPSSGVHVYVGPNDNQGVADGDTPFSRQYNAGTSITLIAPTTAGGNNFSKWTMNGSDYSVDRTITFTIGGNTTMTAVFTQAPPVTHTVTVGSSNPNSGVSIGSTTPDNNTNFGGTTPFTRVFNHNATATYVAPTTASGNTFLKWQLDGNDLTTSTSASVNLDANHTLTAIYGSSALTLGVTAPNGGEAWTSGSTRTVTWSVTGSTALINYQLVALSTDGGSNYTNISSALTPSTRSFSWNIPSGTSTTQSRIRVRALDSNANILAYDASDSNFTISPSAGNVPAQPTGLVGFLSSSGFASLAWYDNSSDEAGFRVERKTGTGNWGQLTNTGTNVAVYQDYGITAGNTYTYRISAYNSAGASPPSAEFELTYPATGPLSVFVTSPTQSSSWLAGETRPITWLTSGNVQQIGYFGIFYSVNGGSSFAQVLPTKSATSVSTNWQIPSNIASSTVKIKVIAYSPVGTELTNHTTPNFSIQSAALKPVARPDVNDAGPIAGTTIQFTGAASSAPAGRSITSYQWEFGDGGSGSGININHAYSSVGTYTARLTVTDSSGQSGNQTLTIRVSGKSLGANTQASMFADPVNLATGNFILSVDDIAIPGLGFPLKFSRFYNSKDPSTSGLPIGQKWTHSYNLSLTEDTMGIVTIRFGDGRQETHVPIAAGGYNPEPGVHDTLEKLSASSFVLRTKDQMNYTFVSGRLGAIHDRNNNTLTLSYDPQSRLNRISDTSGRFLQIDYDLQNRISTLTDPLGRTIQYAYGPQGDLITVTNPRGGNTQYSYDGLHQIITATDPKGQIFVTNEYDAQQRVVSAQRDALGNQSSFVYNFASGLTTVTDPFGNVTKHLHDDELRLIAKTDEHGKTESYEYDEDNNRIVVISRNGFATRYAYDSFGNVTSKIDPLGNRTIINYNFRNDPVFRMDSISHSLSITGSANGGYGTAFEYDDNGNLIRSIDATGNSTAMTYNPAGKVLTVVDRKGNTTTHEYDAAGNRVRTVDALGGASSATFDAAGRILTSVNQRGHTTRFTYDSSDHVLTIQNPLDHITTHEYDPNGNRTFTRDPLGGETRFDYDAKDRLIKVTNALGGITRNEYDAYDRKTKTTDARGNATLYEYDAAGRTVSTTDPLGNRTTFTYDANGNRLTVTDPEGKVSRFSYDAMDRLLSSTDAVGNTTNFEYDALGRRTRSTDALGRATVSEFDALGKLVKVTDAAGGVVEYGYDPEGNQISMKNPKGKVTLSTYDALNRLIRRTEPAGSVEIYDYDGVGNRIQRIDAKNQTVTYQYDAANRQTNIVYPTGLPVIVTYDANGNRLTMQDSVGTSTYTYDALNRMTSYTNPFGHIVGYEYDENSNRKALVYPGSKRVEYTYDAANRMHTVKDWGNRTTTYQYDAASRLASTVNPNGTSTTQSYDDAGRLATLSNRGPGNAMISDYAYTLNAVGNHMQVEQQEPIDPTPNLGAFSYDYDDEDRIQTMEGLVQENDANGNLVASGPDVTLSYDYENRLIRDQSGTNDWNWRYDGSGKRLEVNWGDAPQRFVLDVNTPLTQVIGIADEGGGLFEYYVYGLGLISKIDQSGSASYYHYDSRGSTISTTDGTGVVVNSYSYDPFGRLIGRQPTNAIDRFTFLGRHGVMNDYNGFYFVRARHYSSRRGRFLSKDPFLGIGDQSQTLNRYVYALNNPHNMVDVTGFFAYDTFFTGVGQVANSYLMLGWALGSSAIDAMSGNPLSIGSGFIDALDRINDSTRYMSAGTSNLVGAFRDQDAISGDRGIGVYDNYLENSAVRFVRDANEVYGTLKVLTNPAKAASDISDSIRLLNGSVRMSNLTELLAIYQLANRLDDVTGIVGEVGETTSIVSGWIKALIGSDFETSSTSPTVKMNK